LVWRTQALLEKLPSTLKADDIDAVERTFAIWARKKRPAQFIRATTESGVICSCFGNPRAGKAKAP
jgi:hypothetical protein